MLCFDITNLKNAFKHKQSKKRAAEISKLGGKQSLISGGRYAHAVVREVYKEDRNEKKGMVNTLLLLCGNEKEPKKESCYQCR